MSSNIYSVGLNHVGAYQVSGHPYCKGSIDCSSAVESIQFERVSQWIQVVNNGVADVYVAFHPDQLGAAGPVAGKINHFRVLAGTASPAFEIKTDRLYLVGSADVDVVAGLTNIPASRMYDLDGNGINE